MKIMNDKIVIIVLYFQKQVILCLSTIIKIAKGYVSDHQLF